MNLFKYKVFLSVIEAGSFTKAGELLNLTQSAISHAVSALEQELGLTLLIRGRSGIQLTSNGERLMKHFREIIQMNEKLYQEVALIKGLETGTVKIGTFSSVSIHWLPGIIQKFNEQFPFIELKLLDGNYHDIENWIASGEADFGFVNLPTLDGLEVLPLKKKECCAYFHLIMCFGSKQAYVWISFSMSPSLCRLQAVTQMYREFFPSISLFRKSNMN